MEKVLLLSSKREFEDLIKKTIGERIKIRKALPPAEPEESYSMILLDCDYNCQLDKCLKNFLLIYHRRPIPAAILKPVIIQNDSILPYYFVNILTTAKPAKTEEDILALFKRSLYHLTSVKYPLFSYNPLKKIIEVQKILIESPLESKRLGDLARLVGCSPAWLSLNFKKISGLTLSQFRARAKCCQALWQLVSTNKLVKTIAYELGYHPLYFSNLFRHFFQKAPIHTRRLPNHIHVSA